MAFIIKAASSKLGMTALKQEIAELHFVVLSNGETKMGISNGRKTQRDREGGTVFIELILRIIPTSNTFLLISLLFHPPHKPQVCMEALFNSPITSPHLLFQDSLDHIGSVCHHLHIHHSLATFV